MRDFFLNGGARRSSCAFNPNAGASAANAVSMSTASTVRAAWPGSVGRSPARTDRLTTRGRSLPGEVANSLFNLSVKDTGTGRIEVFRNVSVTAGHPRRIDTVLDNESHFSG